MPRIGLKLREQVRTHGLQNALKINRQALREKRIPLDQLSLRECAQSFMGDDWHEKLSEFTARHSSPNADVEFRLREATEAVDASAFTAITGQLLVDMVSDGYDHADTIVDELFTTRPITNGNFGDQKVPYLSDITSGPDTVQQQMPYPNVGFSPVYTILPGPAKFGAILNVDMEMIATDLTGQVNEKAAQLGRRVKLYEAYKKLYVFMGITNNYNFNGTGYNTYLTSGLYTNSSTTFALTDYTSVNTLDQLFANMVDPITGIPINVNPANLRMVVMPAALMQARRIVNATTVRVGNTATTGGIQTEGSNPIGSAFDILTDKHLRYIARTSDGTGVWGDVGSAETLVFYGDFKKAFMWREVFPVKTVQAPPLHPAEFEQDIPLRVKCHGFGVACVNDPRYAVRAYDTSA